MNDSDFRNDDAASGSYWNSALLIGSLFAVISAVISLAAGYYQISQEASGSLFGPVAISGTVVCLISALAGLAAVRNYTREVTRTLSFGQGAVIGLATAAVIVVVSTALTQLWYLIDPNYLENIMESVIANMEAMGVPDEALEGQIDAIMESQTLAGTLKNAVISLGVMGLLNVLTALLGVRLFAEREETL